MDIVTGTNSQIKIAHDTTSSMRARQIARVIGIVLLVIVGAIVLFLLAIPVLIAPFITGTPLSLSLLLIAIDVALIVALVRFISSPKIIAEIIAGWVAVSLLAIWFSQMFAYTPPITDANGNVLPNSIAVLEKVKLNDSEQVMDILPALLAGNAPPLNGHTTLPTHALDMGIIAPLAFVAGVLLLRRNAFGYLLSSTLLIVSAVLGGGVLALSAAQVLSETLTLSQVMMFVVPFVILTAFALWLTILLLRNVSETEIAETGAMNLRAAQA